MLVFFYIHHGIKTKFNKLIFITKDRVWKAQSTTHAKDDKPVLAIKLEKY